MDASSDPFDVLIHPSKEPDSGQSSANPQPHQQHINNILARDGSNVVVGIVYGNVNLGSVGDLQGSSLKSSLGPDH